jgi:hypothetical protein
MIYQNYSKKISLNMFYLLIMGLMIVTISLHPIVQVFSNHVPEHVLRGTVNQQQQQQPDEPEMQMLLQSEPIIKQERSVQHDAKGHEQHQIAYFQNYDNGSYYTGFISFNSSLPVDIISFMEAASSDTSIFNSSKPWYTGDNIFLPTTLLKNSTSGSVEFEGSGVVAHRAQNDTFTVDYKLTVSNK